MKYSFAIGALIAASFSNVVAQSCAAGSAHEINGNWYCEAVRAISYTNFGSSGTYEKITSMDNGACSSTPQPYTGPLAPLDEEVSWHFRGPLTLKQFAFYSLGTDHNKRPVRPSPHARRHGHQHLHAHKPVPGGLQADPVLQEKRAYGDLVIATINGVPVTMTDTWSQHSAAAADASGGGGGDERVGLGLSSSGPPAAASGPTSPESAKASMNAGAGSWSRQAYYNADSQTADGLTFLNNHGGDGSGVFDTTWGMSLSYASSDGTKGSPSPQILGNSMIGDNVEVIIMTDKQCSNDDCGTVRPGTVAYHGFNGTSKLFLLEFDMPITGTTGFNMDMPAAWILNAQIPRTMQYGQAECSCWTSGCGEWDIFEVLDSGNTRAKSTLHSGVSGGDSNYFQRPCDSTVKVAVVFDGNAGAGHIALLPDGTDFPSSLTEQQVADFCDHVAHGEASSEFRLGPS